MVVNAERQLPGGPRSVAEAFLDAQIRHQVGVMMFAGSLRNRTWMLLDATEADIRRLIRDRMRKNVGFDAPASVQRLRKLLADIQKVRDRAWDNVDDLVDEELGALAMSEPRAVDGILKTVVPVRLSTSLPDAGRLRAIITRRPFDGKVLRDWARKVRRDDIARIHDQIRIGLVQGESVPEISRRVVGTVQLRGRNGVTQVTRRQAANLVRTAANHISNQAAREYFLANSDVIDEEIYLATLDARTTAICRGLDGERFPVGEGRIPPLHHGCRSRRVAVLDDEPIGKRPMKPTTERELLQEFADREGIRAPRRRVDLPHGTKGAFDEFSRGRIRELVGQVDAKVTYQQFLRRQTVTFQDEVLGVTKARLFRQGGLELRNFVTPAGKEFTLRDLARMHKSAFTAAGLDPEKFL